MALLLLERGPAPPSSQTFAETEAYALAESTSLSAGSQDYPNEPAGLTEVTDHDFSTKLGTGWTGGAGGEWSIVSDGTAPRSASSVLQLRIPAGHSGGTGFSDIFTSAAMATNPTDIYWGSWIKFSSDFVGGGSGVQKIWHTWGTNGSGVIGNILIPGIFWSSSAGRWLWNKGFQSLHSSNPLGTADNVLFGTCVLDEWYRMEVRARFNTGSAADGIYALYVTRISTGVTISNVHTNFVFTTAASRRWRYNVFDPTYMNSATGSTPAFDAPSTMHIWWDHYRQSAA